jgi:chromosome segregation ATPase
LICFLDDLQDLNKTLKDEINSLRNTISSLDKEKDKLMNSVDEKTVENVGFRQDLAAKNKCLAELKEQLSQLETVCDRGSDENKQKHKEITALRIQLDRANEVNSEISRRADAGCRENKRLQGFNIFILIHLLIYISS